MGRNRVVLHICDMDFPVSTENSIDYVRVLGDEIDTKMKEILSSSTRVSVTQAAVLTALDFLDMYHKSGENMDSVRSQLAEYLADAEQAKMDLELIRRENDSLKREIERLKGSRR
ncbi:MAG: cell division protein ZapA [Clostridia bacterium]|nr:cell division protein ZapA [Clostridia bacterium]